MFEWSGLKFQKDEKTDSFRVIIDQFEWEVEAHPHDDEYDARVTYKGVKLASGSGKTRHAALSAALSGLQKVEAAISTQVVRRRETQRAIKDNTVRYPRGDR